jgi:hypothetical protein
MRSPDWVTAVLWSNACIGLAHRSTTYASHFKMLKKGIVKPYAQYRGGQEWFPWECIKN